jgi:hypothetical protein
MSMNPAFSAALAGALCIAAFPVELKPPAGTN